MVCVKQIIRESIKLSACLDTRIIAEQYLSMLSKNEEDNFIVFAKFAWVCSDAMLGVLYQLGHFTHPRIRKIAVDSVQMRRYVESIARPCEAALEEASQLLPPRAIEEEEEDAGKRYVRNLLASGKHIFIFSCI